MYFAWAFQITCWTALAVLGWRFIGDGIFLTIVGGLMMISAIGGFLRCARFAPIMAIIVAVMTITSINSCTSKMSKAKLKDTQVLHQQNFTDRSYNYE